MAGQADHAYVVAEVAAAELRADAELPGQLQHLGLQLDVAEAVRGHRARGRQRVEVLRGGVLRGLQRVLPRGAADHHGEVVGRAGGRTDQAQFLLQELHHPRRVQQRLRLLVEVALVGRAAALGHEQELVGVGVPVRVVGVDLDLGRQVGAGVALVPHGQRRELRVAEVQRRVRVVDTRARSRPRRRRRSARAGRACP